MRVRSRAGEGRVASRAAVIQKAGSSVCEDERMASAQTLSDADRRILARWAIACAERVLPLFDADPSAVFDIADAVARAKAYSVGESSAAAEIRKRLIAGRAAKAATTPAGAAAARAVGQAAAVAHMGAHALGAAGYAVKAISLAHPDRPEIVSKEVSWQVDALSDDERSALRLLPPLGESGAGPLGDGLLSRGVVGETIRVIQAQVGTTSSSTVSNDEEHR